MTFDLRLEPWIPFLRRSGRIQWGAVPLLTDDLTADPVVAIAAPRPDFKAALTEFLIGLLTTAIQPADENEWLEHWRNPPEPSVLQAKLGELPAAFDLDGDGPRFLQDIASSGFTETKLKPVERLLFDAPGEQTLELNKDLFVKRERVQRLGRPAAAMALLTMQTYAPKGGSGNRTSMRGGGPLTTLIEPRQAEAFEPLWHMLWANAETASGWEERSVLGGPTVPSDVFPWLTPTRTSDPKGGGVPTSPAHGHPLQVYFGMPRRIRLEFGDPGECHLTGLHDDSTVSSFRMRNYGIKYDGWYHPLSPHYRSRHGTASLPTHAQAGGLGWKDWLGLTFENPSTGRDPAKVVGRFSARRGPQLGLKRARLHAFGVVFGDMSCLAWNEGLLPVFVTDDVERRQMLTATAARFTSAGEYAVGRLVLYVKAALFAKPDEVKRDFSSIKGRFWEETANAFYEGLNRLATNGVHEDAIAQAKSFLAALETAALGIFDDCCPLEASSPEVLRRLVKARYRLSGVFRGVSKEGALLFKELDIPLKVTAAAGSRGRKRKEAAK